MRNQFDGLLQILCLSKPLKASVNDAGKVIEKSRAIWMTGRAKGQSLSVTLDSLLQILYVSQLGCSMGEHGYNQGVGFISKVLVCKNSEIFGMGPRQSGLQYT
jgi:hypothetical protein